MESLEGVPCRVGTPAEGTVHVTYSADLDAQIHLTCRPAKHFTLTVVPSQDGSVTGGGTTDGSGSIDCPGSCTAQLVATDTATLHAVPHTGKRLAHWTGDCAGQGDVCTLQMDADHQTGAVFEAIPPAFEVHVFNASPCYNIGFGCGAFDNSVIKSPGGESCTVSELGGYVTCDYEGRMQDFTLTAKPDSHYTFLGWDGACTGTALTCHPDPTLDPSKGNAVYASFKQTG